MNAPAIPRAVELGGFNPPCKRVYFTLLIAKDGLVLDNSNVMHIVQRSHAKEMPFSLNATLTGRQEKAL